MNPTPRKVVELMPRLHEKISDEAHARRVRMNHFGSILMAYALEHMDDALAEADRLTELYDGPPTQRPGIAPRR